MRKNRRHGIVLLVILAGLAIAGVVIFSVLKSAAAQRELLQTQYRQAQAAWLADSALERAAARLAADPAYRGETWTVTAAELTGTAGGRVVIVVEPVAGEPARRRVRAAADYPDSPQFRARHTLDAVVTLPQGPKP